VKRMGLSAILAIATLPCMAGDLSTGDLKSMSVEDLMNIEVTSVSKTAASISAAPAAVYVITHDDVVRSGATSLPEVLRLAPNLQVYQTSPSNYTITARGFSGNASAQNFSDKLLVLIDGRSVYSPLYSGVYWDAQDVLLEDIDRIEVISGPGATLWGANAVNGVINIITRKASDTQGGTVSAGAGNIEKDGAVRFGGQADDGFAYRAYLKSFERSSFDLPSGPSADDAWNKTQAGFRTDWTSHADTVTVQGDAYRGNEQQSAQPDLLLEGSNLLARWQRAFSASSALQLQAYYDQTERFNSAGNGAFVLNAYDIELQHSFALGSANSVVWGTGDRVSRYDITDATALLFFPDQRTLNLANAFVQDVIAFDPRVKLTLGLKVEDDPYSGVAPLPNARLSFSLSDNAFLWSAISRAIRSPTPFDRDVAEYLGQTLFLVGGRDFRPEKLTAYEIGYRGQLGSRASVSVSTYFNHYDDLRSLEFSPVTILPLYWGNGLEGNTYGVEAWGNYQAADWCVVTLAYTEMHEALHFQPGASGLLGVQQAGDDPEHQAHLRTSMNLPVNMTFDADLRYVGTLPDPEVRAYEELNARLGWRASREWEVALAGANLLHARHQEFTVPPSDAITRSVMLDARYRF
jgi:iron complex outermembrane recepter protein